MKTKQTKTLKSILAKTVIALGTFCATFSVLDTSQVEAQSSRRYNNRHRFSTNIYRCYHPRHEPRGLFICDFEVHDRRFDRYRDYTYRIYCPKQIVRNISNGRRSQVRKDYLEDEYNFNGAFVIRRVVREACHSRKFR